MLNKKLLLKAKNFFMKKILLIAGFILSTICNAQIASTKTMFIDNIDSVCNNVLVNFPIRAKNFTNILGVQGTIKWDSTVLKFDSLLLNTNTSVIQFYDTTTNLQLASGFLTFAWTDTNFVGTSVPDSSILFTLRLRVINVVNFITPIYFSPTPTQLEIDTLDATGTPHISTDTAWQNGYIKFVDTPHIVQNGTVFTCAANCKPTQFIWNIYNSGGVLIYSDTSSSGTLNLNNIIFNTSNTITVVVIYANGNRISSSSTPIVLPLKLISFTAKLQKSNSVVLNWQTTNEINVSHFNLQRSINGTDFTTIGQLKAIGNGEYHFTDDIQYLMFGISNLYYRLELVDKDGSKTTSEMRSIKLLTKNGLSLYPNPATNVVSIDCKNAKQISIINYFGKIIQQYNNTTQHQIINIKQFAKGIYLVKAILNNGEIKTEKLVVE